MPRIIFKAFSNNFTLQFLFCTPPVHKAISSPLHGISCILQRAFGCFLQLPGVNLQDEAIVASEKCPVATNVTEEKRKAFLRKNIHFLHNLANFFFCINCSCPLNYDLIIFAFNINKVRLSLLALENLSFDLSITPYEGKASPHHLY